MAYLSIDTVRARRLRTVAVVPAEIAMDEDHTVRVISPVTGRIRTLDAAPGDAVERGAALARIVSGDLAQAQSDVARSSAQETQSAAALARARDLYAHAVISKREVEQAESDATQASAEASRARLRLRELVGDHGAPEEDFVLRAPIRGVVVDRSANPGAEVRPDAQTPLFVVSALDTVWLTAEVAQRDLGSVSRGSPMVFMSEAIPGARITAKVSYVSSTLDPLTRTAAVRAPLPNPERRLRVRMTGSVRLLAPDSVDTPVVPVEALVTRGSETMLFVETGRGRFTATPVVVAGDDGDMASIAAGLRIGERVVTRGSILLAAELDRAR